MKRILVFGATGTLGLPIVRHLKEEGYDVIAVGHSARNSELFDKLNICYKQVNIEDIETYSCLPKDHIDCILNFAGCLPAMMKGTFNNSMYPDTIIKGTINILDYMRKIGCKNLIFPQSVYDLNYLFGSAEPISADAERKNPLKGDHSIYVICKNATLDILKYYEYEYGIKSIVLRLPGVYQYHPKPYILIDGKKRIKLERVWIEKAKRGENLEIWGDPSRILESVCIEDFLQIIDKSIEHEDVSGIFNVGNGGVTLEDKVTAIRDVFCPSNHKSKILYFPNKKNSTQYVLDIKKTEDVLGYKSRYTWKDYLKELKRHMETEPNAEIWGRFEDYYDILNIKNDSERFEK